MKNLNTYDVEITDTFGGEANYCWVRRYTFQARTIRGAINKLALEYGSGWRKAYGDNMDARYNLAGACVCCFVTFKEGVIMTNKQKSQYWIYQLQCGKLFKTIPKSLAILERENECMAAIIKRMGAIGRNLGLKAAQGYAVNNGLTKAHASVAMQLNAVIKGGF